VPFFLTSINIEYIIAHDTSHFINKRKYNMKKIAIATLLAVAAFSASAVEVGINGSYDYGSPTQRPGAGITIGEKYGKLGVTAGFDRYQKSTDQDKWSLVGSYDVATIAKATVAVKAGAVYLDNAGRVADGYAALVGAGVSYPLSKTVALTADYRYQAGQSRVNSFDGGTVAVGAKYSF
jgi:opacity protein-like surface antigen